MADLQRVPQPVDHNDFRIMYWGRWAPVGKLAELATKNGTNVWANDLPSLTPPDSAAGYAPETRQSDRIGSACVIVFKGPSVRWIGGKGPDHGRADVYLDGERVETVDTYAVQAVAGQVLFSRDGMDPGKERRLKVVIGKDRNPKSTGRMQRIEAFEVSEIVDYPSRMKNAAMKELESIVAGKKDYLKPEQWKPVAYAAQAPVTGVTLDGGPFRVAFDRNIACLNEWFEKKNRYRRETDPKTGKERPLPGFGWEGNLPASSEGRMLGGGRGTRCVGRSGRICVRLWTRLWGL